MFLANLLICGALLHIGTTAPAPKNNKRIYAIIVDAGSTGSRAVGYAFERNGTDLILKKENFVKTKPGLSAFAGKPKQGAKDIMKLVDEMDSFVPEKDKSATILYLRATAGLRLLKKKHSEELLHAVQEAFEKTKYKVSSDAADMLDGKDEGIFSWFTVNYLKKTKAKHTLATMEMGGGSAQVVYEPEEKHLSKLNQNVFESPKEGVKVFSKSYLGLGLSAGRHGILQQDTENNKLSNNMTVTSRCYNAQNKPETFFFNRMNITVRGKKVEGKEGVDVAECKELALKYIKKKVKPYTVGFNQKAPVALSAFYYRAKAAELISGEGGITTVKGIEEKLKDDCAKPNEKDPFLCMDLIFIHTLIKDGFKLRDYKKIQVFNSIGKHELSWALGFAYSKLTEKPKKEKIH